MNISEEKFSIFVTYISVWGLSICEICHQKKIESRFVICKVLGENVYCHYDCLPKILKEQFDVDYVMFKLQS